MFCYCFVSIFATALALPFSFHPPFSSHALPEKCGLTETNPRDRYCLLQQHCWLQFVRQCPWGWRGGSTHAPIRVSPWGPLQPVPSHPGEHHATSRCTGMVWLEGFGLGHGFAVSELFFSPSVVLGRSVSLLAPPVWRMTCKVSLGEG